MVFKASRAVQPDRQKLYEIVLENLTEQIISRDLRPGEILPSEVELAEVYGVSKATVHEALRHLSVFGVVNMRQGCQTTVGTPRAGVLSQFFRFATGNVKHSLIDVLEIRRMLECGAAALAAERISDEDCDALRVIVDGLEENKYSYDQWVANDAAFHLHIARASHNVLMPYMMEALHGVIEDTIRLLHAQFSVRDPDQTFLRHKNVADAILARDPGRAFDAMQVHFEATRDSMNKILAEAGEGDD